MSQPAPKHESQANSCSVRDVELLRAEFAAVVSSLRTEIRQLRDANSDLQLRLAQQADNKVPSQHAQTASSSAVAAHEPAPPSASPPSRARPRSRRASKTRPQISDTHTQSFTVQQQAPSSGQATLVRASVPQTLLQSSQFLHDLHAVDDSSHDATECGDAAKSDPGNGLKKSLAKLLKSSLEQERARSRELSEEVDRLRLHILTLQGNVPANISPAASGTDAQQTSRVTVSSSGARLRRLPASSRQRRRPTPPSSSNAQDRTALTTNRLVPPIPKAATENKSLPNQPTS